MASTSDLASLAQSLKDNEAFQTAIDVQRSNALERLAVLPRHEEEAFYANQAIVAVVDGIKADLEQFIRAGQPAKKPGLP